VIFQHLFGLTEPQLLFDIMLHVGTLGAVIGVFRADLILILRELFQLNRRPGNALQRRGLRLLALLFVASIPTALIGLLFKDSFEALFSSLHSVGLALLVTGLLLWLTRFSAQAGQDETRTPFWKVVVVGLAQGVAITPGISRAGATISAGLLLGMDRGFAARFSFLLSIPAITGAALLELSDIGDLSLQTWTPILAGSLIAGITGYIALKWLLSLVITGNFSLFAYYCWGVGLLTLIGVYFF
jgi:undecaprenyl-diphosphatase